MERNSRRHLALFAFILLIAAGLRLYRITSIPPGLFRDEAMNGCNALDVLQTGVQVFYPENNGREGLYINISAVFVRFLGDRPWVLRLPAAIFGILTVAGVFLLVRALYSPNVALAAAFFLATSFWHIVLSRIGLRAIAAPCFLTWALYLLHRRQWAAAGVIYGLGFHTYTAYRVTPFVFIPLRRLLSRDRKGAVLFLVATLLLITPLAVYFIQHPGAFSGHTAQLSILSTPHPAAEFLRNVWRTARMFFTKGDYNWRHNIAWRAELYWPVAILFALGSVAAAIRRTREDKLILTWLIAGALPAIFSNEGVPHALRSVLCIPPACVLAAIGGTALYSRLAVALPRRALMAGTAAGMVLVVWEPYHSYFDVWTRNPNLPPAFDVGTGQPWPVMFLSGNCTGAVQPGAQ